LRVGVPLVLPPSLPERTLLFVSTPDGLAPYYYEEGLLTTSFAPIDPQDAAIRERVLARCPEAVILGLAPDPRFPLPDGLSEKEPSEGLRKEILGSFPLLETRPPRRYPLVVGSILLAAGLACCILALAGSWSARAARNLAWKTWLAKAEAAAALPASRDLPAALLSAQGAPVPELFFRLSRAWGVDTRIVDLEWKQGKLTLVATSASGLASVRQLTADPWFQGLRVDEIRTQKDGTEILTVEGAPRIDH
ncbi:MAG TPA: hypothetical protein VMQ10_11740, partial [Spirochaetia bacterium]|nr:hypothetical protein [Spirochaetia bacterium]